MTAPNECAMKVTRPDRVCARITPARDASTWKLRWGCGRVDLSRTDSIGDVLGAHERDNLRREIRAEPLKRGVRRVVLRVSYRLRKLHREVW